MDDVNEFSPEFERRLYVVSAELGLAQSGRPDGESLLLTVRAHDQDCSAEFGSVCRYELLLEPQQEPTWADSLRVDGSGRVWARNSWLLARAAKASEQARGSFQVIAHDCAGKKSQTPALVQVNFNKLCQPAWRGKCAA